LIVRLELRFLLIDLLSYRDFPYRSAVNSLIYHTFDDFSTFSLIDDRFIRFIGSAGSWVRLLQLLDILLHCLTLPPYLRLVLVLHWLCRVERFIYSPCNESGIERRALGVQRFRLPTIHPLGPYILLVE
jgi:hypothetical protein